MHPHVVVFEDSGWQRLLPLVYIRATFQLICGMDDLLAKVRRLCASTSSFASESGTTEDSDANELAIWCRSGIADVVAVQTSLNVNRPLAGPTLFLNGRGLWHRLPEVAKGEPSWVGRVGGRDDVACIFADAALAESLTPATLADEARVQAALAGIPRRDVSECVALFEWPWQIVHKNQQALVDDWKQYAPNGGECRGHVAPGSYLLAPESIYIGEQTRIKPCVVIDAEQGPIWIGKNVTILPHCYIEGPAFIGDDSLIQPGSTVHAGTTIGRRSKVGGEIEASIIHGYSNKQHDGFLGHSYVGSWVNIAADCINSDLKNTYGTVRVPINGREVETGELFVGMFVGDFSKAGINVSFPTGAVIGFCSSVFAPRSPKFVPSFAWIDGGSVKRLDEQRGMTVARRVMARRDKVMSAAEEEAFLSVRKQALAIEYQSRLAPE